MKHDFRHYAKVALEQAKSELESGDDARLRYAALELRMSIEALTYDRAQLFEDELPSSEYDVWQPKRVMETLLEIEPLADQGSTIRFKKESKQGEPEHPVHTLGTEVVFTFKQIKKSYDALGSYLHHPTLKQIREKSVDLVALRRRCIEISAQLDAALASKMYNVHFKSSVRFSCGECGKIIHKRYKLGDSPVEAKCQNPSCEASYLLTTNEQKVDWERLGAEFECPSEGCSEQVFVAKEYVRPGSYWTCTGCQRTYELTLAAKEQVA